MMAPRMDVVGALVDLPNKARPSKVSGLLFSDVLLIVGLGLGLLIILAGGVYLWSKVRKKRRRHVTSGEKVYRRSHSSEEEESVESPSIRDDEAEEDEDPHSDGHHHGRRRYKYRVRRRGHRSRNPTLSQTGGLPPVKAPESDKPVANP